MASAAERQRRYYRHKRGDHSMCDPARRCELAEAAEANEAVARASERPGGRYGPRGQQLWDDMAEAGLNPLHRLLLDEACRMADRLDRLDEALANKGTWLRYETEDGTTIVLTIDNVLGETRQQAVALRSLLAEIRAGLPKPASKPSGSLQPSKKGGGLGDLTARIAARRGASAG